MSVAGVVVLLRSIEMLISYYTMDMDTTDEQKSKIMAVIMKLNMTTSEEDFSFGPFEGEEHPVKNSILIVFTLISLGFSILLLLGIQKNNSKMVKGWIIYSGIFIGMTVVIAFVEFILGVHWAEVLLSVPEILIGTWFLLIVVAFYQELVRGGEGALYNRFGIGV